MAFSLKRVVDYKLLYDSLADPSNGMIKLTTLTTRWPRDLAASNLPRGLPEQWRTATDDNGYLDWEKFSSALKKALEEDKPRLSRNESSRSAENPSAQRKQQFANRAPRVTAEEIETFLSSCRGDVLVQALGRTRKEVYKCQMSLHELESSAAAKDKLAGQKSDSSRANGHVKVKITTHARRVDAYEQNSYKSPYRLYQYTICLDLLSYMTTIIPNLACTAHVLHCI